MALDIGGKGNANINVEELELETCVKCGNTTFDQRIRLRKLPITHIANDSGQEAHVPEPAVACCTCGHVLGEPYDPYEEDDAEGQDNILQSLFGSIMDGVSEEDMAKVMEGIGSPEDISDEEAQHFAKSMGIDLEDDGIADKLSGIADALDGVATSIEGTTDTSEDATEDNVVEFKPKDDK